MVHGSRFAPFEKETSIDRYLIESHLFKTGRRALAAGQRNRTGRTRSTALAGRRGRRGLPRRDAEAGVYRHVVEPVLLTYDLKHALACREQAMSRRAASTRLDRDAGDG